jgi:hypothetical protein
MSSFGEDMDGVGYHNMCQFKVFTNEADEMQTSSVYQSAAVCMHCE